MQTANHGAKRFSSFDQSRHPFDGSVIQHDARVYCLRIPKEAYIPSATTFDDFKEDSDSAMSTNVLRTLLHLFLEYIAFLGDSASTNEGAAYAGQIIVFEALYRKETIFDTIDQVSLTNDVYDGFRLWVFVQTKMVHAIQLQGRTKRRRNDDDDEAPAMYSTMARWLEKWFAERAFYNSQRDMRSKMNAYEREYGESLLNRNNVVISDRIKIPELLSKRVCTKSEYMNYAILYMRSGSPDYEKVIGLPLSGDNPVNPEIVFSPGFAMDPMKRHLTPTDRHYDPQHCRANYMHGEPNWKFPKPDRCWRYTPPQMRPSHFLMSQFPFLDISGSMLPALKQHYLIHDSAVPAILQNSDVAAVRDRLKENTETYLANQQKYNKSGGAAPLKRRNIQLEQSDRRIQYKQHDPLIDDPMDAEEDADEEQPDEDLLELQDGPVAPLIDLSLSLDGLPASNLQNVLPSNVHQLSAVSAQHWKLFAKENDSKPMHIKYAARKRLQRMLAQSFQMVHTSHSPMAPAYVHLAKWGENYIAEGGDWFREANLITSNLLPEHEVILRKFMSAEYLYDIFCFQAIRVLLSYASLDSQRPMGHGPKVGMNFALIGPRSGGKTHTCDDVLKKSIPDGIVEALSKRTGAAFSGTVPYNGHIEYHDDCKPSTFGCQESTVAGVESFSSDIEATWKYIMTNREHRETAFKLTDDGLRSNVTQMRQFVSVFYACFNNGIECMTKALRSRFCEIYMNKVRVPGKEAGSTSQRKIPPKLLALERQHDHEMFYLVGLTWRMLEAGVLAPITMTVAEMILPRVVVMLKQHGLNVGNDRSIERVYLLVMHMTIANAVERLYGELTTPFPRVNGKTKFEKEKWSELDHLQIEPYLVATLPLVISALDALHIEWENPTRHHVIQALLRKYQGKFPEPEICRTTDGMHRGSHVNDQVLESARHYMAIDLKTESLSALYTSIRASIQDETELEVSHSAIIVVLEEAKQEMVTVKVRDQAENALHAYNKRIHASFEDHFRILGKTEFVQKRTDPIANVNAAVNVEVETHNMALLREFKQLRKESVRDVSEQELRQRFTPKLKYVKAPGTTRIIAVKRNKDELWIARKWLKSSTKTNIMRQIIKDLSFTHTPHQDMLLWYSTGLEIGRRERLRQKESSASSEHNGIKVAKKFAQHFPFLPAVYHAKPSNQEWKVVSESYIDQAYADVEMGDNDDEAFDVGGGSFTAPHEDLDTIALHTRLRSMCVPKEQWRDFDFVLPAKAKELMLRRHRELGSTIKIRYYPDDFLPPPRR
eukprot:TRINITY_DN4086_c0_g2_i1.p1 TRINITY_DN4086_c0_g2~~TRINITY_DN4086_c0_g2_i1.p1  ORF type:complete len:1280 (+),score=210.15 TRINITY_DN4086_c0_g2_i1:132-3971(+)